MNARIAAEVEAIAVCRQVGFERLLARAAECLVRAARIAERAGDSAAHDWCQEGIDAILEAPELKARGLKGCEDE